MLIPAAALMMWVDQTPFVLPSVGDFRLYLGALLLGIAAYYTIVVAVRLGEISFVTPFRYSRILFALLIGVGVFDETPDALTLTGATIIVGSGLYTLWPERRSSALAA